MVHMYAVPTSTASLFASQPRMTYLTNTEVDNSGRVRAIHSHTDIAEIGFVYYGRGVHSIDGREYHSQPGDLLLYNRNVLHQDLAHGGEPMRFFLCGVADLNLEGLAPGNLVSSPESYHLRSGRYFDFILKGFETVEYALAHQQPHITTLAHGFLHSLHAIIRNLADDASGHASGDQPAGLSLAEEMRRYIDQNYALGFSLDDLAQAFQINRFYAAHVFSETFGSSPIQYRTRRRIGEAQSLLTSSDFSITYIASVVGYDDPNRFSQVFGKMVGMSPSKYRDLSVRSQQPFKKR